MTRHLETFDEPALAWRWRHPDPAMDALQQQVMDRVGEDAASAAGRRATFERVRALAEGGTRPVRSGRAVNEAPARAPVPYLTEPWYC
jgi:hypothetical protein